MRLKVPRLLRSTHTRQAPFKGTHLKGDVLMSYPKSTRIVVFNRQCEHLAAAVRMRARA